MPDSILVQKGALENGQVFDTSKREGRTPFELVLGKGSVIRGRSKMVGQILYFYIAGWEEGLIGICQG